MKGNPKVFISHAHEDNELCAPLLSAFDAWEVDYWFDTERMDVGDMLSARINQAIAERDVFLRICTQAAQQSYWVQLETGAFRGLQAREHGTERASVRRLINLMLDSSYVLDPLDYATVFIDASTRSRANWMAELRRALGLVVNTDASIKIAPDVLTLKSSDVSSMRRLPIYLLIDTSGSMGGLKIQSINTGISTLYQDLMGDPSFVEIIHISTITFSSTAQQMALMPLTLFNPPQLNAGGTSAMGAALRLLNDSLDQDIIPNQPDKKGDYKPLVFLLTDGAPTDSWQDQAMRLSHRKERREVNVIAVALGNEADNTILQQLATTTIVIPIVSPESIASFFRWIYASIRSVSRAVHAAHEPQVQLPPPPGVVL